MNILGLVYTSHDAGLALLTDGKPNIILEEERFNRIKHTLKRSEEHTSELQSPSIISYAVFCL